MVMEVVVRKTTRGPDFKKTLQVNESDTLFQLKHRISEVFGIEPHSQFLHCFGRDLDGDSKTLEGLGLKDESVIFIIQNASSRSLNSSVEGVANDRVASFQTVKEGLNFATVCTNPSCEAFQNKVIVNLGLRKSIVQRDRWECNRCPSCDSTCGDITALITSSCTWKYSGYTAKGEKVQRDGVAERETESLSLNLSKWSFLEITASRLP